MLAVTTARQPFSPGARGPRGRKRAIAVTSWRGRSAAGRVLHRAPVASMGRARTPAGPRASPAALQIRIGFSVSSSARQATKPSARPGSACALVRMPSPARSTGTSSGGLPGVPVVRATVCGSPRSGPAGRGCFVDQHDGQLVQAARTRRCRCARRAWRGGPWPADIDSVHVHGANLAVSGAREPAHPAALQGVSTARSL